MESWRGNFNDGETALSHPVRVSFAGGRLRAVAEDGATWADWPLAELAFCEEFYADGPVRLRRGDGSDARLIVAAPGFAQALTARAPHLRRARVRGSSGMRILGWGTALLALVAGLFFGIPRLAGPVAALVPLEWEERLGTAVVAQVADETERCASPAADAALAGLVERLTAGQALPYRFEVRILDRDEINAFAAPGGQLAVFRGLIDFAGNGEELAGVVAHEVAHVAARHPTEGLIRSLGLSFALGAVFGDFAGVGAALGEIGVTLANLAYSRAAERDADREAVHLLRQAGIDSRGLAAFFTRLQAHAGEFPRQLALLSSHPLHASRMDAVAALAGPGRAAFSAEEWAAVRAACSPG